MQILEKCLVWEDVKMLATETTTNFSVRVSRSLDNGAEVDQQQPETILRI